MPWKNAHAGEAVLYGLGTDLFDLLRRCIRLQQRVVDRTGELFVGQLHEHS
jgi:hypothetical protein